MFPDFMDTLEAINRVNKNKLLAILEEFLMFCMLGLKKTHVFYDGISAFINNPQKNLQRKKSF